MLLQVPERPGLGKGEKPESQAGGGGRLGTWPSNCSLPAQELPCLSLTLPSVVGDDVSSPLSSTPVPKWLVKTLAGATNNSRAFAGS